MLRAPRQPPDIYPPHLPCTWRRGFEAGIAWIKYAINVCTWNEEQIQGTVPRAWMGVADLLLALSLTVVSEAAAAVIAGKIAKRMGQARALKWARETWAEISAGVPKKIAEERWRNLVLKRGPGRDVTTIGLAEWVYAILSLGGVASATAIAVAIWGEDAPAYRTTGQAARDAEPWVRARSYWRQQLAEWEHELDAARRSGYIDTNAPRGTVWPELTMPGQLNMRDT